MNGFDETVRQWVVTHRAEPFDTLFRAVSFAGAGGWIFLVIALVVALRSRRWSVLVAVAAADGLATLLAFVLKRVFDRARPPADAIPPPLVHMPSSPAFPSGHTTTAFACAAALAILVPRLAVPVFLLAAAIGYSRVYLGVHWPTDVLAGAVLGLACGALAAVTVRYAARRRGRRARLPQPPPATPAG